MFIYQAPDEFKCEASFTSSRQKMQKLYQEIKKSFSRLFELTLQSSRATTFSCCSSVSSWKWKQLKLLIEEANIVFCSTNLSLASTRWVQLTLSSLCLLFQAVPSINLSNIKRKILGESNQGHWVRTPPPWQNFYRTQPSIRQASWSLYSSTL